MDHQESSHLTGVFYIGVLFTSVFHIGVFLVVIYKQCVLFCSVVWLLKFTGKISKHHKSNNVKTSKVYHCCVFCAKRILPYFPLPVRLSIRRRDISTFHKLLDDLGHKNYIFSERMYWYTLVTPWYPSVTPCYTPATSCHSPVTPYYTPDTPCFTYLHPGYTLLQPRYTLLQLHYTL